MFSHQRIAAIGPDQMIILDPQLWPEETGG